MSQTLGVDYSYRRLNTLSVAAREKDIVSGGFKKSVSTGHDPMMNWLDAPLLGANVIGTTKTTAQLNPEKFVIALAESAQKNGAHIKIGVSVVGLIIETTKQGVAAEHHTVRGVRLADGSTVFGDAVVIAMGPWSNIAASWLPENVRKLVPVRVH